MVEEMAQCEVTGKHGKGRGRNEPWEIMGEGWLFTLCSLYLALVRYSLALDPNLSQFAAGRKGRQVKVRVSLTPSQQYLCLQGSSSPALLWFLSLIPTVDLYLLREGLCHKEGVVVYRFWPRCLSGTSCPGQWHRKISFNRERENHNLEQSRFCSMT